MKRSITYFLPDTDASYKAAQLSSVKKSSSWVRQTEVKRIFNLHRYQVKNMLSIVSSIFTLFEVRAGERDMRARNLFQVSKCKGFYSFKLEKNTMRKILKLNIFHLVEKIVRFFVDWGPQIRIALFTNKRILKFRSQLTIAFFAAVNHLNGPLRKQNFTLRVQKVMVCDLQISIRFVCFSVSRFVACDRNYD